MRLPEFKGTPASGLQLAMPAAPLVYLFLLTLAENSALIGGIAATDGSHRLTKRMDLESCLGQFDVHRNTIIRTGESQVLGGKYLQGIELDTVEECQRLCCETDSCDVYIFEEKAEAYCYLFECGPPENFHCKFTRHANYTSAVLTAVRRPVEVTTTAKPLPPPTAPPTTAHNQASGAVSPNGISQQELELSNLKKADRVSFGDYAGTSFTGGSQLTAPDMGVVKKDPLVAPANHCGRFQFTCHSGECIAVYNACDGIPQCVDGSDEGPECSGVSSSAAIPASPANSKPLAQDSVAINLLDAPVQKPSMASVPSSYISAAPPATHVQQVNYQSAPTMTQEQTAQQELHRMQHQQLPQAVPNGIVNNREDSTAWMNRKIVNENAPELSASLPQPVNTVDLNSRIFSHKGGLQVAGSVPSVNGGSSSPLASSNGNYQPSLMYDGGVAGGTSLQRNNAGGVYLTQQDVITGNGAGNGGGLMYMGGSPANEQQRQQQPQQQAIITPQGHIILPTNLNWPQQIAAHNQLDVGVQRQQQQQQTISSPMLQTPNIMQQQLPQDPTYVVESVPSMAQQQQQQLGHSTLNENHQQQQQQQMNVQQSVPSQQAAEVKVEQPQQQQKKTKQEYEDYEDENSTEPPKKKPRKHKKVKANDSAAPAKDPIQMSLDNPSPAGKQQLDQLSIGQQQEINQQQVGQQQQVNLQQQVSQQQQPIQHPPPVAQPPQPSPVHEQYKMIHESLAMEFRDHDGLSERPSGAVLSLTLGVLITAALAIIIGCRLRTVGRRARRPGGKGGYSHEADFLVNGMYL